MSPRELRLRERIDVLLAERDRLRRELERRPPRRRSVAGKRCAYCGEPSKRSVCVAHEDLVELDALAVAA